MRYWILKSEPLAYSWARLIKEKKTHWDGVRNFQARNNLARMQPGDFALFYHSGTERKIMGIARIISKAYPDFTADDPRWVMIDVEPVQSLKIPVELDLIKTITELQNIKLVRQARLSVSEINKKEFDILLTLGETSHIQ